MTWEPKAALKIRNLHSGEVATVLRLEHPEMRDGTGPLWNLNFEKLVTKEEVKAEIYPAEMLGKIILVNGFAYEANLLTYWEPVEVKPPSPVAKHSAPNQGG